MKEETGFDVSSYILDEFIDNASNDHRCRLFIAPNVSMDTKFQPMVRKEVKVIYNMHKIFNGLFADLIAICKANLMVLQNYC